MLDKSEQPDVDTAIAFLKALRPDGPWNLTAIVPDGPVQSASFTDAAKARTWLADRVGKANLHYCPNPASSPSGRGGRVRKDDLDRIEFLHGDFDVDKLPDAHELAPLSIAERNEVVAEQMGQFDAPTLIVD